MTAIVEGFYKHGKIELLETPPGWQEGHVWVLVMAEKPPKPPPCFLTFGKYSTGRMSALEDFQDAQWHGEPEGGDNQA